MGLLKLRLLRGLAVAPSELMHSNTETVAGLEMSMAEHSWGQIDYDAIDVKIQAKHKEVKAQNLIQTERGSSSFPTLLMTCWMPCVESRLIWSTLSSAPDLGRKVTDTSLIFCTMNLS